MPDGIQTIQECFKHDMELSNLTIQKDGQRMFMVTLAYPIKSKTSFPVNQDNIDFLIKNGFRITNCCADKDCGLVLNLYQRAK